MRMCIVYSGPSPFTFLNNLCNVCDVCEYCSSCRPPSLDFCQNLYGIFNIPDNLPPFLDNPQQYLPPLPACDLVMTFNLHPDILLELASTVPSSVKAVIAPSEAPHWVQPGLRGQLQTILQEKGIEYAFPKPYCALDFHPSHPFINQAIATLRIGKPVIHLEVNQDIIYRAVCDISAPCGCTWYICEKLKNKALDQIADTVAGAHHAYPCNASMMHDPEVGDSLLHEAGYIAREAVISALRAEGVEKASDLFIPRSPHE
ncbi:MAG: thymidylate synthase [Theionarchaea archaeon]|nr:thymidylate synthase [Theionarchaea archaeon]